MLLDTRTPVYQALAVSRERSEQLAAVMDHDRFVGVITISDILRHILPEEAGTVG